MKKVTIITGHYGSGKTNVCVNLALDTAKSTGAKVSVIDLDTVNPYFRTADFKSLFQEHNIELISSIYANSNLDTPAITFGIESIIKQGGYLIIDVGGDDTGAYALGQFADMLTSYSHDLDMFYIVNAYRYMTNTPNDAVALMHDIENASRLRHTGIINNSNLGGETTIATVESSKSFASEVAKVTNLPIVYTVYPSSDVDALPNEQSTYPMHRYVKPIWE
jgi:hypothetical protein